MSDIVFDRMLFDYLEKKNDQSNVIARLSAEVERLRLTDEEREAVEWFAEVRKPLTRLTQSHNREKYKDTLRGLLERTNHDAVPEAKANADGEPAPKCGGEAGLSSRDGTGNTHTLTDEEREAIEFAICSLGRDDYLNERHAEQLQETLERLKERLQ
jgi:hypothetical protein